MQGIQATQSGAPMAATLLDAPTGVLDGGDMGAEMAALAVKNGEAERATAHDERSVQEAAAERADDEQVQAMRSEASSMRSEGWFDATVGVASACVAIGFAPAQGATESADAIAGAHVIDGAGKLGDGFFKAGQHDNEADAARDKAAADRAESAARDVADAATDANASISAALDFDRTYVSLEAQTQSAALHRA